MSLDFAHTRRGLDTRGARHRALARQQRLALQRELATPRAQAITNEFHARYRLAVKLVGIGGGRASALHREWDRLDRECPQ